MGGYSVQDIETRLRVIEDKTDFIMRTFSLTKVTKSPLAGFPDHTESKTLLDVYRELKRAGAEIID